MIKKLITVLLSIIILTFCYGCESKNRSINPETIPQILYLDSTTIIDNVPLTFKIEKLDDVIQGSTVPVSFTMTSSQSHFLQIGGFDLLIRTDRRILSLYSVNAGQFLNNCSWEYFTFRLQNYPDSLHIGDIRVVSIADAYNNPPQTPNCYDVRNESQLFTIEFSVTNDRTYECEFVPIHLFWNECDDNILYSKDGDSVYHVDDVYFFNPEENNFTYYDTVTDIPSQFGIGNACDTVPKSQKMFRVINGGVQIVCMSYIDATGDINLNEISYQLSDLVLFNNYFVYGESVFNINYQGQIHASDVNKDGITLSVEDYVYMARVMSGDANPYPDDVKNSTPLISGSYNINNGIISVEENLTLGAIQIIVDGEVVPTLLVDSVEMVYHFNGEKTNIFISSLPIHPLTGDIVNLNNNAVGVHTVNMADTLGYRISNYPVFSLYQNDPNPVNYITNIAFSVGEPQEVTLSITQYIGKSEKTIKMYCEPGTYTYQFDATLFPTGRYTYTLTGEKELVPLSRTFNIER